MRTDKYMMAKAWMKQDQAPQAEALDTWNTLEAEFNEERKAMLMASAETDKIKEEMNKKFGPGTVKYGSELPPIQNPFDDFEERNPAAEGGRMRFDDGLSAKQKKALTITYPKNATKDLEIKKTSNNALSAKRKLDIIKFVTDFKEKNNRLPTRNEIRINGKFDYQFIKDRMDDGSIETLSTSEAKKLGRKKVDLKEIGKKTSATKTKNQPYVVTEGASQTVGDVLDIKFPNEEMKNNYLEDLKKIYNEGYRRTIYKDPGVLTTKELAEKYFGKANDFTISKIGKMNTFFANQLGLSFENLPIETKSQEVAERRKEKITKGRKELTGREKLINTQQDNLVSGINKYYKKFPDEVINNKELTNAILSRMNDDGTVKLKTFDSEIEKNKYLKKMALSNSGVMSIDHLSDVKFGKKNVEFPINRQLIPTKTNQSIITKAKSLLSKNLNKTDEASQAIVKNVLNTLNNLGQRVNVDGKIYGADILAAIDETKGTLPNMERSINKFNLNDVVKNSNFKINPSLIKTSNIDYVGGKKEIKNIIKLVGCPNFKAAGGRIEFESGGDCFDKGQKLINSGMKNASKASLKNLAKLGPMLLKAGSATLKGLILPEAVIVGLESAARVTMGDTPSEAILRATDYLTPDSFFGDFMQKADLMKIERTLGKDVKNIAAQSFDRTNQSDKINKLEEKLKNLEAMTESGDFGYIGDLTNQINMTKDQIKQEKNKLKNTTQIGQESRDLYTERALENAYDASMAKSKLSEAQLVDSQSENPRIRAAQEMQDMQSQEQKNKNKIESPQMKPNLSAFVNFDDREMELLAARTGQDLTKLKQIQDYMNDERKMSFADKARIFGKEQTYGTQGNMGQPVERTGPGYMTNYKPLNRFGSQERPVLYPKDRGTLAEGGITQLRSKYEYKK